MTEGGDCIHEWPTWVSDRAGTAVLLEELEVDGSTWRASCEEGEPAVGDVRSALAAVLGRPVGDEWVQAVGASIDRETSWRESLHRRTQLEVFRGAGTMLHVTDVRNRPSIDEHGLDWRRMGSAPGVANTSSPEVEAIWLSDGDSEADWFVRMAARPCDIWEADVTGLWIETGDTGHLMTCEPIERRRLRRRA